MSVNKATEVSSYLSNNNLLEVFASLVYEITLARARVAIVAEKIIKCRELFADMRANSFSASSVVQLQTSQLDLISTLFMLLEDYLSYSHYLNATKKELLPENLLNEKTVTWNHLDYLRKLSIARLRDYLLLPSLKNISLTPMEKKFVKHIHGVFVDDVHSRIGSICKFFINYNRVYVRYKHVFSAMVGLTPLSRMVIDLVSSCEIVLK